MRERPDNEMTRKLRPAHGEEEEDIPGNEDDAHASDLEDLQNGPPGTLLIWPALVLVLLCALHRGTAGTVHISATYVPCC